MQTTKEEIKAGLCVKALVNGQQNQASCWTVPRLHDILFIKQVASCFFPSTAYVRFVLISVTQSGQLLASIAAMTVLATYIDLVSLVSTMLGSQ